MIAGGNGWKYNYSNCTYSSNFSPTVSENIHSPFFLLQACSSNSVVRYQKAFQAPSKCMQLEESIFNFNKQGQFNEFRTFLKRILRCQRVVFVPCSYFVFKLDVMWKYKIRISSNKALTLSCNYVESGLKCKMKASNPSGYFRE